MRQLPEIMMGAVREQKALDAGPQDDDLVYTGTLTSDGGIGVTSPQVTLNVRGADVELHGDPKPLVNLPSGEYIVIVTVRKAPVKP
jgi:hypothetical protein